MVDVIKSLVDFVEGKTTIDEFKKVILNDSSIERFLKEDPTLKKETYIGDNTFDFIINEGEQRFGKKQGWERIGSQYNIQGAICQHLERKNIPFKATSMYKDRFNLMLDTQPNWLDIDEEFFYNEILLKAPDFKKKSELKKWIKNRVKELFKYASKPPRWIQNPDWLIIDGKPLVFLCQQDINNYFHDKAVVYVFFDEVNKEAKTVIQVF